MKKLGKKVQTKENIISVYGYCICAGCPCGPTTSDPITTTAVQRNMPTRR